MATTAHVPVEVYLRSSYEPDAEYVDGEIEERATGELAHPMWQKAILKWFWKHEQEWGFTVLQELRVQVAPTRFRVPDGSRYENGEPRRNNTFSHAAKGITFDLNEIKNLLDV